MSAELQLQMRRNVEQAHTAIDDLDGWLGDIGKRDANLRGIVMAPTGGKFSNADAGTDDEEEAREIEEAKAELRKLSVAKDADDSSVSTAQNPRGDKSMPATGSAGPLTHAQKYGKWEQYDADAVVKRMEAQEADRERLRKELVRLENQRARSQARKAAALASAAADALRLQGNAAFGAARYEEAVGYYTDALGHTPRSAILYTNRALALLKLHAHTEAEEDCDAALLIDSAHVKAMLRRAQARHALGKYDMALADLEAALEHEPRNSAARGLMAECRRLRSETAVRPKPLLTRLSIEQVEHDPDNDNDPFVMSVTTATLPEDSSASASMRSPSSRLASESEQAGGAGDAATRAACMITPGDSTIVEPPSPSTIPVALVGMKPTAHSFSLPATLADMERVWRSLRGDLAEFAVFVRRVDPLCMEALFRHNLPAEIFSAILLAMDAHFTLQEAPAIVGILRALTKAGRFSILTMCLDKTDRAAVDSINLKLIQAQGSGDLPNEENLAELRKAYS